MKKNSIYLAIVLIITLALPSCTKKDFDNNYYDPESSVQADIPKLFTGLLYNHNRENINTIFPRYWTLWTFRIPVQGTYSQTWGYTNASSRYESNPAYNEDQWNYFYTSTFASYRELQRYYNDLSTEEQEGYRLFMEAANVFLYDQAAQIVDLWGDIPFFEAGQLVSSGGTIANAPYDSQEEIYNFFLDDLKRVADWLNAAEVSQFYKAMFDRADIVNLGDIEDWKIYTNSLRLRLAMRISYQNETKAREIASEIINNPATYPVVTSNDNSVKIDARGDQLRSIINVSGIRDALETTGRNIAPGHMINNVMNPSNDPRLYAMFSRNAEGEYRGLDPSLTETQQSDLITANLISRLDSATYSRNDKYPGIIITAAEISLLKAEAAERWGYGDAKALYEQGLRQSIGFIYYINSLNDNADGTSYTPKTPPTSAAINTFLAHDIIAYDGTQEKRLEKIGTQIWINFGLLQAHHAWAEYRRTKFPQLAFAQDAGNSELAMPPNRLMYPENERLYNPENYQAVRALDTYSNKIFWDVR